MILNFDNFIVDKTNKSAYVLAKKIASDVDCGVNFIYIYGESGTGKTHLLRAVENEAVKLQPGKNIVYLTAQAFVNELVTNIGSGSIEAFRKKYNTVDYILIDNIEYIDGKEATQSEIIGIIDALLRKGAKIAVASFCAASSMDNLSSKLNGRFRSGFVAKIETPDYNLKRRIIERELKVYNVDMPSLDIDRFAAGLSSNIFVLKGAVKMFAAVQDLAINKLIENYC